MWTMYVRVEGHSLVHIVEGVSTRRLLDVLEHYTMVRGVQMIEIAYGNEVYTVYMKEV